MRKVATIVLVVPLALALVGCGSLSGEDEDVSNLEGREMTVYYSPSCNCCKDYVEYLEEKGVKVKAEERNRFGMKQVKQRHGVSRSAASCHTGVIGDYVVEGHVPAQTISRLLEEQPGDIQGVTIPGMPQHAPGMGGPIGSDLSVFSLDRRGQATETYDEVRY